MTGSQHTVNLNVDTADTHYVRNGLMAVARGKTAVATARPSLTLTLLPYATRLFSRSKGFSPKHPSGSDLLPEGGEAPPARGVRGRSPRKIFKINTRFSSPFLPLFPLFSPSFPPLSLFINARESPANPLRRPGYNPSIDSLKRYLSPFFSSFFSPFLFFPLPLRGILRLF